MVRTDRYKIIVSHGDRLGELYDLDIDPSETLNLGTPHRPRRSSLRCCSAPVTAWPSPSTRCPCAAQPGRNSDDRTLAPPAADAPPRLDRPLRRLGVRPRRRRRRARAGWLARRDAASRGRIAVPLPARVRALRDRRPGLPPVVWYRRTFDAPRARRRPAAAALRRRRLRGRGLGRTAARRRPRGRADPVHRRRHRRALRRRRRRSSSSAPRTTRTTSTQPRGKQDWQREPHAIWYHRTTGIWQPVWLEAVAATCTSPTCTGAGPAARRLRVAVELARPAPTAHGCACRLRLRGDGALLADGGRRSRQRGRASSLPSPALGNGQDRARPALDAGDPNLLDAGVALVDRDGGELDAVDSYPASASSASATGRFLLNGRPYYLRLGARAGLLAAVAPRRSRRRRAARRGRADQGAGLQRRPHPPEGRGPALPLLVRPARPAGLGRDGQRLRVLAHGGRAADPRVARGGAPRPQPPLDRHLGPDQRELGRRRRRAARRSSGTASRRCTT